ncbi:MAG: tetratricopeptide repeat protein [Dehalococcoidia bacterium]|nr:tetratricopeptide repeat protein [Dehalococcoidia bacterium]
MSRKILLAIVAGFALLVAVLVVFVSVTFAPEIMERNPFGKKNANIIKKQEQANLAQRLEEGRILQRNGDYDRAIVAFAEVANAKPDLADVKEAQFRLGETYDLNHNFALAAATFQQFYDLYADDGRRDGVEFRLGVIYRQMKQWDKAIGLLNDYALRNTAIDPYTRYQLGLANRDAGNLARAALEFAGAVTGDGPRLFEIDAMEQVADAYLRLKDYDNALLWYDKIRLRATTDAYRAELNYRSGIAFEAAGRTAEAKNLFMADIASYPSTYYALQSLQEMNRLDILATTYLQEGLVFYFNGQYGQAIASLDQVLIKPQDVNAVDALYYQALSFQKQGNQTMAIAKFDQLVRNYPGSARVGSAWYQKGANQERAGSYTDAIVTYRQLYAALPQDYMAGEARWEAALVLEYLGRFNEAAREYTALVQAFPNGKYAEDALFRQGLAYFKLKQYDAATQVWEGYLKTYPAGKDRNQVNFWTGKAYLLAGKTTQAEPFLRQAIQATPDEYYGFRAKDITQTVTGTLPIANLRQNLLAPDSASERQDLVHWLGTWVTPPPTISVLSGISLALQQDPGLIRGAELRKVGLLSEANNEFLGTIAKFRSDGIAQLQLALYFRDEEIYQLSIATAERTASLSGERNYLNLPRLLQKLLYPTYYSDLILAEAGKADFDPLLYLALVRQESRFDKNAGSSANAHGLTQVIPATGEWLAQQLKLTDFTNDDLFKPYLSIRLGAYYLGSLLDQFDGNSFFALAGYNGGPGNVDRWSSSDPNYDSDLFTEDIDYSETQLYVEIVVQNHGMYKAIYGSPGP